jgi:hypothetical protein
MLRSKASKLAILAAMCLAGTPVLADDDPVSVIRTFGSDGWWQVEIVAKSDITVSNVILNRGNCLRFANPYPQKKMKFGDRITLSYIGCIPIEITLLSGNEPLTITWDEDAPFTFKTKDYFGTLFIDFESHIDGLRLNRISANRGNCRLELVVPLGANQTSDISFPLIMKFGKIYSSHAWCVPTELKFFTNIGDFTYNRINEIDYQLLRSDLSKEPDIDTSLPSFRVEKELGSYLHQQNIKIEHQKLKQNPAIDKMKLDAIINKDVPPPDPPGPAVIK